MAKPAEDRVAGEFDPAGRQTVENGSVDEVEIVNVTSIDMSPDASRLTGRCFLSPLFQIAVFPRAPSPSSTNRRYEHETEQVPTEPPDRLLQSLEQPLVVTLVLEDGSPEVATGHHVMDRAGIFDPQRSGHGPILSHGARPENRK